MTSAPAPLTVNFRVGSAALETIDEIARLRNCSRQEALVGALGTEGYVRRQLAAGAAILVRHPRRRWRDRLFRTDSFSQLFFQR